MGIPATGAQITLTGVLEVHIVDSKIAEVWSIADMAGLMEQLGVMPPTHEDYTWGAPSEVTGAPSDPQSNTALVLYVVEKFWNQKNVNVLDETHSLDSIAHNPIIPGQPLPFDFYKQVCLMHIAAFPDMKVTTDDIIAEWDKVVIRWTVTGTHQGELMGIPASGRQVTWSGFTIYRFADGKIVESWWAYDALGMMQQITEEKVDVEDDIAAIEGVLNQYPIALNTGDLELWLSLHADDVVKMPPDAPAIFGNEALRAKMEPAFDNFTFEMALYPEQAQVSGDLGFARGNYTVSMTPKAGGETIISMPDGKYSTICKRQADGSWKIYIDCYNSNVPPTVE